MAPAPEPELTKAALSAALGVSSVVIKRREVYLYQNVRIHLDDVQGLGTFLEFEAVLGQGVDEQVGYKQIRWLCQQFGIKDGDVLDGSYGDRELNEAS